MIDESLSTAQVTSIHTSGAKLAQQGTKGANTMISAQVIPSVDGQAFEVHLEAAVARGHGVPVFTKIGVWEQSDDTLLSIFPVSLAVMYRFKHISGIPCRVLLAG